MKKYYVEKFNASDDSFKITETYVLSGEYIEKNKSIFSIESSKADIEVEAQDTGYIYYRSIKGETINVGDLFYIISNEIIDDLSDIFREKLQTNFEGFSISKKARLLMDKHGISPSEVNKTIIKETDILDLLKFRENKELFDSSLILQNNNKTPIIIIGAGGGSKMCIDALSTSTNFKVVGLLDDKVDLGEVVLGVPVVGNILSVDKLLEINIFNFVIAFGVLEKRNLRFELYNALKKKGCKFPNIIHSKSIIEKSVELGEGNVILAGSNIGSCVKIGNLNYINNNTLISHDCTLIDNIHVAPGAVLASSINIDSHVLIGMNTTIYYGLKIGESSTILNGLIINNNIEKNVIQKTNN
jgi:sugar O-acyltransferase (sialic acid O-acetyltransferase NeuD family)